MRYLKVRSNLKRADCGKGKAKHLNVPGGTFKGFNTACAVISPL